MTDKTKTKAQRAKDLSDAISREIMRLNSKLISCHVSETVHRLVREAIDLPDDPPGDAGLLRELRDRMDVAARRIVADDDLWSQGHRGACQWWCDVADRMLAAAPADKPDEPAQCNATMQRVGPSGWVMCNQPAGHSGPHRSGAHVYPQDPAPADERERRIARWRRMALREPCLSAASECDGYWLDDDEIDEAIAIMRTAPDSDAALRAERAEAEVARLRAECERLGEVLSEIASNDEIDSENAKLRIEVERLTKERDEARAILNGPSYRKTFACPCCESILKLRPTPDGGVAVDVQKERDSGWEALERLRDKIGSMHSRYDIEFPLSMTTAVLKSIADDSNKALASRPGAGKEGAAS